MQKVQRKLEQLNSLGSGWRYYSRSVYKGRTHSSFVVLSSDPYVFPSSATYVPSETCIGQSIWPCIFYSKSMRETWTFPQGKFSLRLVRADSLLLQIRGRILKTPLRKVMWDEWLKKSSYSDWLSCYDCSYESNETKDMFSFNGIGSYFVQFIGEVPFHRFSCVICFRNILEFL